MQRQTRLFYLIKQVESAARMRLARTVARSDLTVAQYTVMSRLAGHDGLSSARLARFHSVSPQTMNEQVAALEERALITRKTGPDNRRILLITLTDEGRRLLDACDRDVDRVEDAFFDGLGAAELRRLRSLLETVVADNRTPDRDDAAAPAMADAQ